MPPFVSIRSRFMNRLFGTPQSTAARQRPDRRVPARQHGFERLEDRRLLSAAAGFNQHEHDMLLGLLSNSRQSETHQINGASFEFTWDAAPAAEMRSTTAMLAAGSGSLHPLSSIPALHSNPGAAKSLFLDFDGHFEPVFGAYSSITTPVYDIDGDSLTFSDRELSNIQATWNRIAEDCAPFNIDVTTVEPSVLAAGTPIDNANGVALRVAIGGTNWVGGGAYAGFSYIGSFTNAIANVSYVFPSNLDNPVYLGDVVSHEAGHAFGLQHQSIYDANGTKHEYNYGNSSWAPLMGITFPPLDGHQVTTWYNGTSSLGPTVYQDDMAILAGATNGFGYRSDDHGNTRAHATPLSKVGATWNGSGIVGTNSDIDMFSFTVAAEDTYRIVVNVDAVAPNLDAVLELRNQSGQLLASASPQDTLNAQIVTNLTPGNYYVAIKSSGTYGWIGQYSVHIDTPLPGDYSGNGIVDAADYTLWRHTLGGSVTPFSGADGSGNGVVDQADYDLWRAHFGQMLSGSGTGNGADVATTLEEPVALLATPAMANSLTAAGSTTVAKQLASDVGNRPVVTFVGSTVFDRVLRADASLRQIREAILPDKARRDDELAAWLASRTEGKPRHDDVEMVSFVDDRAADKSTDSLFDAIDEVFEVLSIMPADGFHQLVNT